MAPIEIDYATDDGIRSVVFMVNVVGRPTVRSFVTRDNIKGEAVSSTVRDIWDERGGGFGGWVAEALTYASPEAAEYIGRHMHAIHERARQMMLDGAAVEDVTAGLLFTAAAVS